MTWKYIVNVIWKDLAVYGGISLLFSAATIWTLNITSVGSIIMIIGSLMAIGITIIIAHGKISNMPNYITTLGVSVWTVDGAPDQNLMETVTSHFICELPIYYLNDQIAEMLNGVSVMWFRDPVHSIVPGGWFTTNKAGLQQGKAIAVQWKGSIRTSAIFHELGHMVQQFILKRKTPDYKHEDTFWENIIKPIEDSWKENRP